MLARRRELLRGLDVAEGMVQEDGAAVRGALLDALAKLPDRQRRAYLLREVHGLRVAEIAAGLALSTPRVEQDLFAARNRLAEELVFGDSLTCDAARRLSEGPLASVERRALRRHFRTCPQCRTVGARVPALLGLEWVRGRVVELLAGGAAPVGAKAGAVVAATVAAGITPALVRDRPAPMRIPAEPASPHQHVAPAHRVRRAATGATAFPLAAAASPRLARPQRHGEDAQNEREGERQDVSLQSKAQPDEAQDVESESTAKHGDRRSSNAEQAPNQRDGGSRPTREGSDDHESQASGSAGVPATSGGEQQSADDDATSVGADQ
jgi:hypothetical protein